MDGYRIMVIDDDMALLKSVETILIENGYIVSLAKSGKQALNAISRGNTPDLIILDIGMPEMDGYETFKRINEIINIPIIFLTSMEDATSELTGLELGAIDYITKPFVTNILLARIKNHLQNISKYRKEALETTTNAAVTFDDAKLANMQEKLTDAEYKTAKLICLGYTNQEIANQLGYSYSYVKKLVYRIFEKLDISKRNEIRSFFIKDQN